MRLAAVFCVAAAAAAAAGPGAGQELRQLQREVTFESYVKPSNTGAFDLFGGAVAFSSPDGVHFAVSAWNESSCNTTFPLDDACVGAGAVYVFGRAMGVWVQKALLKASNAGAGDNFGASLSMVGDRLAVGAPYEQSCDPLNQADNSCPAGAGAVYIFERQAPSDMWLQTAYLKANLTGDADQFGHSVSLSETGSRLAVGAVFEASCGQGVGADQGNNSCPETGAVYVFDFEPGVGWSQTAFIKSSNAELGDRFGFVVQLQRNLLVASARGEDSCGEQDNNDCAGAGAAYVFAFEADGWSQVAYLKASNADPNDWFGAALSVDDGRVAVAGLREDSSAAGLNGNETDNSMSNAGAVYVFDPTPGGVANWTQTAYLKAGNPGQNDRFGHSVSLVGSRLLVGARFEKSCRSAFPSSNACINAGALYLFELARSSVDWQQTAFIKINDTAGDQLGNQVAMLGTSILAGALHESSCATGVDGNSTNNACGRAGAAYVFSVNPDITTPTTAPATSGSATTGDGGGANPTTAASTTAVSSPLPSPSPSPPSAPSSSSSSSGSPTAENDGDDSAGGDEGGSGVFIALGAVGGCLLLLCLVAGAAVLIRNKRQQQQDDDDTSTSSSDELELDDTGTYHNLPNQASDEPLYHNKKPDEPLYHNKKPEEPIYHNMKK